jgi:small subunit ribosomal protein S20
MLNKAIVAIETDASTAEEAVREAVSALDRAVQKGVVHANAAARGKSRLLKRFNLATANAVVSAAVSAPEAEKKPAARAKAAPKKDAKPAARGKAAPKASDKPAARRTRKT